VTRRSTDLVVRYAIITLIVLMVAGLLLSSIGGLF
jgi:hypothetical protein